MNSIKKLKVAIIVDNTDQPFLIYDLYKRSLDSDRYSVDCLIVQEINNIKKKTLFNKLTNYLKSNGIIRSIDRILFEVIDQLETQIVKKKKKFEKFFIKKSISKFEIKKIFVNPDISHSGLYYKYNREDLDKIKDLNVDVLIRGGSGILQGDILNVCPLGIISFHHGDNDFYRGGPPGFWEVYNHEPSTGFVIQRLTEVLDGGDVIFKGHIPTSFFYKLNLCRLFLKSSIFLHKTLEKIADNVDQVIHYSKLAQRYKIYKVPRSYQSILYLFKTLFLGSKKILNKFLGKSLRWNVCYQFTEDWKNPFIKNSIIIKNPKNRFLADPFVINYNNRSVIFVEDYDFNFNKGKISAYEVTSKEYKELGVALEEKFHLSYPFLFESKENLFMVPETHESKDIRLYKCIEFPLKWELHKILMKNVNAVDTNIFKYNNKYWIFTNLDTSSLGDYSSELHIFYADNFDSTTWKPHSLNPVIFDSKIARNGGMIYSDQNQLHRVFQKQDFDMYGASLGVSKIKTLTEEAYEEELLINVSPDFFENILGIHSFAFNSGILVNDFVKYEKKN